MAKRTNTQNTAAANTAAQVVKHSACFTMKGTLDSVFVGKKYAYATVKVTKDNGYYDQYKVQCPLDFDFPDDGQEINLAGYINRYKTDISFIEASCFA